MDACVLHVFVAPPWPRPPHPSALRRSALLPARLAPRRRSVRLSRRRCAPPAAAASSAWRSPQHLVHRALPPGARPAPAPDATWRTLAALALVALVAAVRRTRKRATLVKLLASAAVLSSAALATGAYGRFNALTTALASEATAAALHRTASVGRLRRVTLPGRLHFAGAALGRGVATAPDVTVRGVVVGVSRVLPALRDGRPLVVNVELAQPAVKMRQIVTEGPLGAPVAKWDAAIPAGEEEAGWSRRGGREPAAVGPRPAVAPPMSNVSRARSPPSPPRRRSFVLGRVVVRNASVSLQPAELPGVYGQGPELVEIRNGSAELVVVGGGDDWQSGLVRGRARGFPVGGGSIDVSSSCNLGTLQRIAPGDPLLDLRVTGRGLQTRSVAAFLNLPFRTDRGRCEGSLDVRFLYKVEDDVPEMHGTTTMDGVSMQFHPDPTTPAFTGITGSLRFDDKTMFLDGPNGDLGSLPMTVVGSIDLLGRGEYNLVGYVRSTDVNNVVDTFDIDKFVPVVGRVQGEARMTGPLDEPLVQGWVMSVGDGVFDRVPVDRASVEFDWDAAAGVLKFSDITAALAGGGDVSGSGGLYFDMTKITPYDVSRPTHHPNSPKALEGRRAALPPPPGDELDIDLHAPARPFDSMHFDFAVRNVPGGNLLTWYGGPLGASASASVGVVEGDAVLAGHAKDANCRALWRSVTPPPPVSLVSASSGAGSPAAPAPAGPDGAGDAAGLEVFVRPPGGMLSEARRALEALAPLARPAADATATSSFPGSDKLGGGDFRGAVFLKLGDLPAARRVRLRTTVSNFDLRRVGWGDPDRRGALASAPAMILSADTYYKGVFRQRLLPVEEGSGQNPRTPQAELLGADGVLAVRDLRLNKLRFTRNLTGSLRFGTNDFALSLEERGAVPARDEEHSPAPSAPSSPASPPSSRPAASVPSSTSSSSRRGDATNSPPSAATPSRDLPSGSPPSPDDRRPLPAPRPATGAYDELRLSGSVDGNASLSLRRNHAEVVLSVVEDAVQHRVLSLFAREFSVDDVLGGNGSGTNGIPAATVGADCVIDLSERRGDGSLSVKSARYADLALDSVLGDVAWRGDKVLLQRAVARVRRSEYHLDGSYCLPAEKRSKGPSWELRAVVPSADVRDLTGFLASRRTRRLRLRERRAVQSGVMHPTVAEHVFSPRAGRRGTEAVGPSAASFGEPAGSGVSSWSMPDLPFDRQVAWFQSYVEAEKERSRHAKAVGVGAESAANDVLADVRPGLTELRGAVRGTVIVRYDSNAPIKQVRRVVGGASGQAGGLSRAILEPLAKSSFEFDVRGDGWTLGPHVLGEVNAVGTLSGARLALDSLLVRGPNGFEASAGGVVTSDGLVSGHALVKDASAASLSRYVRGRFRLSGNVSARLDVGGVVSNPVIDGRAAWTGATLNDRSVRNAQSDVHCRNGRCTLDVNARIGGRGGAGLGDDGAFDVRRPLTGRREKPAAEAKQGAARVDTRARRLGEPVKVSASAPVRLYALEYLRKRTSPSVWTALEPLLAKGASGDEDNWISMDVDVRKYGVLVLSAALPDLGWIGGHSDINLEVRGTLADPVIAGRVSVADGELWPSIFTKPVEGVRGEVLFEESGAVTARSVSGRYNGRPIMIAGSLPLSERHVRAAELAAARVLPKDQPVARAARRRLAERQSIASSRLDRFSRGITLDVGDVLVDVKDHFYGKVSGRVAVKQSVLSPCLTGSISLSKGVVYLASPPLSPESALASMPAFFAQIRSDWRGGLGVLDKGPKAPSPKGSVPPADDGAEGEAPTLAGIIGRPPGPARATRLSPGAGKSVGLNNLKLTLGKEVQLVYPYLLKFAAAGVVTLDGSSLDPVPSGTVRFTEGEINVLTSKMEIKRGVDSYARFDKGEDVLDPVVNLVLEGRDVMLQIKEARASTWSNRLTISDKRGEAIDESDWIGLVSNRLEEVQRGLSSGRGIPSLAAKYLINSYSLQGRIGSARWRLYPTLVSPLGGLSETQVLEDIGLGAELEVGRVTVSGRTSVKGARAGSLTYQPNDRTKIELESNGPRTSAEVEVRVSRDQASARRAEALEPGAERIVIEAPQPPPPAAPKHGVAPAGQP